MCSNENNKGFSLFELMIAMAITLVVMAITSTLLVSAFNIRSRENQRSDALADAQRALNIMSRELANSGFGLTDNGIVAADSGLSSIRVRSNLNAFDGTTTSNVIGDRNEDIKYLLYQTGGASYVVRLDIGTQNQTTVLANRVDALRIRYYPSKISYITSPNAGACDISTAASEVTSKTETKYIVITLCVELPAVGRPNAEGYQPASRVQLTTDVYLRNGDITSY